MPVTEQRDPEQDDPSVKNPTWEMARDTQLQRDAEKRQQLLEGQQQALVDIVSRYEKAGMDPIEIEERRKGWEQVYGRKRQELADQQQEKMDRLEITYRGPPSERER